MTRRTVKAVSLKSLMILMDLAMVMERGGGGGCLGCVAIIIITMNDDTYYDDNRTVLIIQSYNNTIIQLLKCIVTTHTNTMTCCYSIYTCNNN